MTLLNGLAITLIMIFSALAYMNEQGGHEPADQGVAASAPPIEQPPDAPPSRLDHATLSREIRERVAAPLRESRIDLRTFSRARIPRSRTIHYQLDKAPDDRKTLVEFRIYESRRTIRGLPEADALLVEMPDRLLDEGLVQRLATGTIDARDGTIRLVPAADERPHASAYLPLEEALAKLGVRRRDRQERERPR